MWAHLPLALAIQGATFLLGVTLGVPPVPAVWIGCFNAIAVCVTREVTQREYQWIERFGGGLRRNMPRFAGYRVWEWNAHSKRETVAAAALALGIALAVSLAR